MDTFCDDAAVRNRLNNFKLGTPMPSAPAPGPTHRHARSHSRNRSTSSFSFPPQPQPAEPTPPALPSRPTSDANPAPSSKRNSHHRRRSSVSTRHESAELMGFTVPELPSAVSEDNVNLGEKDSIRRRALWALEGKSDVSFSKVEIPELGTPDMEKMMFDLATKQNAASATSFGNSLNPLTANKRDSFKLLGPSSSSKDQLHTLVEEEEEDEAQQPEPTDDSSKLTEPSHSRVTSEESVPMSPTPVTPVVAVTKPTPSKPRPATLNLRPLSLTPENLSSAAQGLPTPSLTPSPQSGLRPLSLSLGLPSPEEEANPGDSASSARRNSVIISPTPASRRPALNLHTSGAFDVPSTASNTDDESKVRRSSISYRRCSSVTAPAGLPTPEMTPTFSRRSSRADSFSTDGADDEFFPASASSASSHPRALSASEQHFLFKSHNALLARITDLERALSTSRRRESGFSSTGTSSRPLSLASNSSGDAAPATNEPSDEMLRLIADLKSERDELKRDVDGWRVRVADLESQLATSAKRVENERREAWVARSRVGLLEVEKKVLTERLETVDQLLGLHDREKALWDGERLSLQRDNDALKKRNVELEEDLRVVRRELEQVKLSMESVDPLATPTPHSFDMFGRQPVFAPKKHGLGFMSVDSESSATDVEPDSSDDGVVRRSGLKAVEEEQDEDLSDEDSALAGYEDEEESDASLHSSGSYDSDDEVMRSTDHLHRRGSEEAALLSQSVFTFPPRPAQASAFAPAPPKPSCLRTWTFPTHAKPVAPPQKASTEGDRFFDCLADVDTDTDASLPSSPSTFDYEKSKGVFTSGVKAAALDDNASFFFPTGVGMPSADSSLSDADTSLTSVIEEEEEDDEEGHNESLAEESEDDTDMFGEMSGIMITFTPPQEEDDKPLELPQIQVSSPTRSSSPPPTLPAFDFGDDDLSDDDTRPIPFSFGISLVDEPLPTPEPEEKAEEVTITPVPSLRRASTSSSSPSMIPRASSPLFSASAPKPAEPSTSTPVRSVPFPVGSPASPSPASRYVTPPTRRGGTLPSFIPQAVGSPSPLRSAFSPVPKPKAIPQSTFIRQPTARQPLQPLEKGLNGSTNVSTLNDPIRRTSDKPTLSRDSAVFNPRPIDSPSQVNKKDVNHQPYDRPSSSRIPSSSRTPSSPPPTSIMPTTPRLSFQTFTNFIPLSWGASRSAPPAPPHSPTPTSNASSSQPWPVTFKAAPKERGFVPREKQLRLLKARIEVEGRDAMRAAVDVQCKNCDGKVVLI